MCVAGCCSVCEYSACEYFVGESFSDDCFEAVSVASDWNFLTDSIDLSLTVNAVNCRGWNYFGWTIFWMNLPPLVVTRKFPPSMPVKVSSKSNVSISELFSGSS